MEILALAVVGALFGVISACIPAKQPDVKKDQTK